MFSINLFITLWSAGLMVIHVKSIFVIPSCDPKTDQDCEANATVAKNFVDSLNDSYVHAIIPSERASFNYATNITDYNSKIMVCKAYQIS